MKKFFVVLAILFIGILLAGCTSQPAAPVATPTPTPVPTTVATTAVPTAVPTTEVIVVVVNTDPECNTDRNTDPPALNHDHLQQRPDHHPGHNRDMSRSAEKVIWVNDDPFKPHGVQATNVQTAAVLRRYGHGNDPLRHSLWKSSLTKRVPTTTRPCSSKRWMEKLLSPSKQAIPSRSGLSA